MIGRLKQAGKRRAAYAWALALLFAVAPALSMALAVPAGSFANAVVHSHDHGDVPHQHHRDDHDRANHGMTDDLGTAHDSQSGHNDHDRVHVHYDASCPSIIIPHPVSPLIDQRLSAAVDPPPARVLHEASRGRLFRPPIA